jgi:hypothetical protein
MSRARFARRQGVLQAHRLSAIRACGGRRNPGGVLAHENVRVTAIRHAPSNDRHSPRDVAQEQPCGTRRSAGLLKEARALRTETTVNDTRDFGIGRLLTTDNWDALLRVGHNIKQRLLYAHLQACPCAPDGRRSNASCCRPPTTASPPPGCASATRA